jgi:hypothetical protein
MAVYPINDRIFCQVLGTSEIHVMGKIKRQMMYFITLFCSEYCVNFNVLQFHDLLFH